MTITLLFGIGFNRWDEVISILYKAVSTTNFYNLSL